MQLKHYDHDGRARFVTFCTHKRIPVLTNPRFRAVITESLDAARQPFGFCLLAYVIMPEHVHLVLVPMLTSKCGDIIAEIKRSSAIEILEVLRKHQSPLLAKMVVRRDGIERPALWMRRCYDHNCRTDESLWETVRYCHNNPVTRGLVRVPGQWVWSSYRWYQGDRNVPLQIDENVPL